jgi:hypothetical protein
MHDDESTDVASFASPGRVVALRQAADPHSQDHLTWAYQTHVTAIYQYVYSRVGNRPDAEDLTSQGANVVMCGNSAAKASRWCAKEEGVPFRLTCKSFEGGTPLWLHRITLLM